METNSQNIGSPPGTLFYSGEVRSEPVKITLIEFNETEIFEDEYYSLEDCISHVKPNMVKWINVGGIHLTDLVEGIGKIYDIHPLTLEDIVHVDQRPKFEDFEHYVIAIMKMITFSTQVDSEQLAVILFENTVITFQEPQGGDAFDIIRNRLRTAKGRVRKLGADYLAYALMDAVVDCYFKCIEKIGDKIEDIEEDIINRAGKAMADEIDFTILTDMLCELGWRKVILSPMTWEDGLEVDAWTDKHIKGHFENMGLVWVFEDEEDANWFALRWL
jgi:magnesium transporter